MKLKLTALAFLAGCLGMFLMNVSIVVLLGAMFNVLSEFLRFANIAESLIGGYSLGPEHHEFTTWQIIQIAWKVIPYVSWFLLIGNAIGWFSYNFLYAVGKRDLAYISLALPWLAAYLIGHPVLLYIGFLTAYPIAALARSIAESEILRSAVDILKSDYDAKDLPTTSSSIQDLVAGSKLLNPGTHREAIDKIIKIAEDKHHYYVAPDYVLDGYSDSPTEKSTQSPT